MKYLELLRAQIAEMIASRDAKLASVEALAETLGTETRAATPDEDAAARAAVTEAGELDVKIKEAEARHAELSALSARQGQGAPPAAPAFIGRAGGGDNPYDIDVMRSARTPEVRRDIEARALRALEAERDLDDVNKARIDVMLRNKRVNRGGALARHLLVTGRPEYRDAWLELAFRAQPILTPEQHAALTEVRGLQITTDNVGGYLMPFTLDPTIILTNDGTVNPIRQLATVQTVATDNWQGVSTAGVTASWDAEEAQVSDDTPTLAQPAIAIHQAQAFVPFSVQAEDDLEGLAMEVSALMGDARDRLEQAAHTTGTGSAQPYGLVTEATTVTSTTTDTYAVADVYKLQNAVGARYQPNASWMAALATINLTRAFGTALGHAFLTDLGGGQPPQILGKPLYENSNMDGVITGSATNLMLLYGDFKAYRIHDRIGMTIELVPHLFGANQRPTGQRGWYMRFRSGARLVNTAAVKVLDVT